MYENILKARLNTQNGYPDVMSKRRGLYGFFYRENCYNSYELRYLKGPTNLVRALLYLTLFFWGILAFFFFFLPLAILLFGFVLIYEFICIFHRFFN